MSLALCHSVGSRGHRHGASQAGQRGGHCPSEGEGVVQVCEGDPDVRREEECAR